MKSDDIFQNYLLPNRNGYRVYFQNVIVNLTRGKPRAAVSDDMEGMEGQDKIQIDEVDRIGDEGQGDAQNNEGILGTYVARTLLLHIY